MSHPSISDIPGLNGRRDLYGNVHKGLRLAQCQLLARLGNTDYENAEVVRQLMADMRALLGLAASHVEHEDRHIHQALRARAPDSTRTIDEQHDDHREAFKALESLVAATEAAPSGERAAAGRRLYLAFAAYVGGDLEHMHEEETVTAPLLWSLYSDEELIEIETRIVSSIPPEKSLAFMRFMIPAISPAERAALLGGMKLHAPREAFDAVIEFAARPNLPAAEFADLVRRLDLAA